MSGPPTGPGPSGAPLAGLRVMEMAALGPVPLAGQLMSDLGARVTVIDRTPRPADPADINRRGKEAVVLDLKTARGRAAALDLACRCDILIEGFRPGVMERLDLGPEPCLGANPRLIYGRMTGWGQHGPLSATAGHDINYLALSGVLHAIGPPEGPPVPPLNLVADYAGGTMMLLFGLLAAVHERGRTGRGQVVDAAMLDGVAALLGLIHGFRARGDWVDAPHSNRLDGGAPFYRCYATADGGHVAVGALEDGFFAELAARLGLPDASVAQRHDRRAWPELTRQMAAAFATRSRDEWAAVFDGSDACVTPVLDFAEAAAHPHSRARGIYRRAQGVLQAAPAPRFSHPAAGAPGAAVPHGPDTPTREGTNDQRS